MRRVLLSALLVTAAATGHAAAASYDMLPTAAIGTARTVALGGASSAVDPDGYEAVIANPAGMSGLAGTGLDFGSDGNTVDNVVVDLSDRSRSLDVPIKYSFGGVRYVTSSGWGIGAAVQTPFDTDLSFRGTTQVIGGRSSFVPTADQNDVRIDGTTYSLGAGKALLDGKIGAGISVHYTRAKTDYEFTPVSSSSSPFSRSAAGGAVTADFGLIGRPYRWLSAGAVYQMGYRIPFDAAMNEDLPVGFTAFRDLKTPDRVLFGLRVSPWDNVRLFMQGRVIFAMRSTSISGSGVFPRTPGNTVASGRTTDLDGGWGLEYVPYDVDDLTIKLRTGGYFENTGIEGGYTRYHRTAGFAFEPWFLSLSLAIDVSEYYNNFVAGFSVDLLQIARRTSRMYGWNVDL